MRSELLKLKRTFVPPVVLLTPLLPAALVCAMFWGPRGEGLEWDTFVSQTQVNWALLMLPLVVSLVVAQVLALEHASGGWRPLLALPRRRARAYLDKAALLLALTALMNLLALLATLAGTWILPHDLVGEARTGHALRDCGFIWLAGTAMLAVTLWIAARFPSFLAPTGVGAAATVTGFVLVNSERYGPWWPWNLAVYAALEEGPHRQVLLYSVGLALVALIAGLIDFGRRDVR